MLKTARLSIRFDRTPTCDRQTQTDRRRAIASTRANKTSRGQKPLVLSAPKSVEIVHDRRRQKACIDRVVVRSKVIYG